MAKHNEFGKWGEDMAVKYLLEHGFEVLARNWRHEHKEIDIIAQKDEQLYFVEVKTRHGEEWNAEEAITAKTLHPSSMPVSFPVIAVVVQAQDEPPEIRWHDNYWEL